MFRTKSLMRAGAFGLAAVVIAGCGGGSGGGGGKSSISLPPAVAADLRASTPAPTTIITADNALGFQLLAQLRTVDAGRNVFISPTSIALAFDIAYNGAAGTTQQSMAQTLDLGASLSTPSDLNSANAALQASLVSSDPAEQLTVANSLWYRASRGLVLSSFVNTNTQYYGSKIGDLSGAPGNINAWVAAETNGKITQIVGPDVQQDVAAIVNAVYFKGSWNSPFDTTLTTSGSFTLADGATTVPCSLMHQTSPLLYFQGDHFQAVKLPYGKGIFSMLVFLPTAGVSLDNLISEFSTANLSAWLSQFTAQEVALTLPKFTSTYTADLKPAMSSLGMGIAFDANQANFSNLGPGLFLTSATHVTYVSVDEAGTVAAGATSVGVGVSAEPVTTETMTVNRPFVCAILDEQTGGLVFIGAIDTP